MKRGSTMIAETLGFDTKEFCEYKYQKYVNPSVYAVGNRYFAASESVPKHNVGSDWREHSDQFGARNSRLKIWVCEAI